MGVKNTLSRKLGFGTAVILLLVVGMGGFSVLSHQGLLTQLRFLVELSLPVDRAITRIALHHGEVNLRLDALLDEATPTAVIPRVQAEYKTHSALVDQALLDAITLTEGSRTRTLPAGFQRIDRAVIRLKREYQELEESAETLFTHQPATGPVAGTPAAEQLRQRLAQSQEHIDELGRLVAGLTADTLDVFEARIRALTMAAIAVAIVGVIIGCVFFTVVGKASKRIRLLAVDAGEIAMKLRNDELPDEPIADESTDEIGALADALDFLVDAVRTNVGHRQQLMEELHSTSAVDSLTGALSRQRFLTILTDEIARAGRYGSNLSILYFDVDRLGQINDRHGNETGDYVLRTVADIVRHNLRKTDHFVRWTGGSFLILATETPVAGARYFAQRIRRNVEVHPFDVADKATISGGIVQHQKDEAVDDLIQRAEAGLGQAKSGGGNQIATS